MMAMAIVILLALAVAWVFKLVHRAGSGVTRGYRRQRRRARGRQVELAAEEAAAEDPIFTPETVKEAALELHADIIAAWNKEDSRTLAELLGRDLLVEWKRRLKDFKRKGWHNVSTVLHEPTVEYVGLVNRPGDAEDRVVVHIEVALHDVVTNRHGHTNTRNEDSNADGVITQSEYWTLARRNGGWILASIEQEGEGSHHLSAAVVPSPWDDDRLHDEAVTERAVAAAVADEDVREIADVDFSGDARVAALDMAIIDGRFAPDVLEVAARRALVGWTEAVDGDDAALEAIAVPGVGAQMLHPGDPSRRSRLVVRGQKLRALRITAVDAAANPPAMTVEADITGARYVEDRDTTTVLSGDKHRETTFTERWRLVLDGHDNTPWRLATFDSEPTPR
ncbi:MAG: TIM44-like domain-containing protein [Actinomycetota bacterium]